MLVEFYRGLAHSTGQTLVGTFTQSGFQIASRSAVDKPVILTPSSPVGRRPNNVVLDFAPCLITHLIIRLYQSERAGKSLALSKLRLLGYHMDDGDWTMRRAASLSGVLTAPESILMSRYICIIHQILICMLQVFQS